MVGEVAGWLTESGLVMPAMLKLFSLALPTVTPLLCSPGQERELSQPASSHLVAALLHDWTQLDLQESTFAAQKGVTLCPKTYLQQLLWG